MHLKGLMVSSVKQRKPQGLRLSAQVLTRILRRPLRLLAFLRIFRVQVIGRENVPRRGAVIIASNHKSIADPVYAWGAMRRAVVALAMIELWKVPVLRWILNWLGHIPVDRRNGGGRALVTALAVLYRGGAILIYPEGRCSSDGLLPFQPGVASMALKTGAPIVPTFINGSNDVKPLKTSLLHLHPQAQVHLVFGTPIDPAGFTGENAVDELVNAIREAIVELSKQFSLTQHSEDTSPSE